MAENPRTYLNYLTKTNKLGLNEDIAWLIGHDGENFNYVKVDKTGNINAPAAERWAYKTGDSTIFYVGTAEVGSAESAAVWQIMQIDTTNGKIKWAASAAFTQIWDNREALTYE